MFKKILFYLAITIIIVLLSYIYFLSGKLQSNQTTISDLKKQLAECQNNLTSAMDRNTKIEAELERANESNQSAIETVGRINAINNSSNEGLKRTETYNRECTTKLDECLRIFKETGTTN